MKCLDIALSDVDNGYITNSIALSVAKDKLSHYVRKVGDEGVRIIITVGDREAAELAPVGSAAVSAGPRSPWVLVSTAVDNVPSPFVKSDPDRNIIGALAGDNVEKIRVRTGDGEDRGSAQSNLILWLSLDTRAAILAYPTAHWDAFGRYEFIFADAEGTDSLRLREWGQKQSQWDGNAAEQAACHKAAIEFGCRMLGAAL